MIDIINISHHYAGKLAVSNIAAYIPEKSLTAVIGPNGSGKSTIIKIIAGIIKPTKGYVTYQSKKIAYLPQQSEIEKQFPFKVKDVVRMGLFASKSVQFAEVIESLQISSIINRPINSLSGG